MNSPYQPQYTAAGGQSRLVLTGALNPCDQVSDLMAGFVQAEGMHLNLLPLPVEEIFFRFTRHQPWAVSEMSFAKYLALTATGNAPMVALPVFTSRMFRHSAIYVRKDRQIRSPKDLEGLTVGIPEWAQTAGVYVRGMLKEHFGVDLTSIRWIQAGVNQPGREEKVALHLPNGIRYQSRPEDCLNGLIQSGDLDAVITARPINSFLANDPDVVRLFPDAQNDELEYHKTTGIFPIMHLVVLRRTDFEANPWIAMSLYKAFEESKRRSLERLLDITAAAVPMPWASTYAKSLQDSFGPDLWPYGIERNIKTLEAFCRFAYEQGITEYQVRVDDLFPPEVTKTFRV